MAEDYFLNCKSEENIRTRYKALAVKLHPDKSKDPEAKEKFQEMIRQRDLAYRHMYKDSGLTDKQIDAKLNDFLVDLDKLNFSKLNSIAFTFADQLEQEFGDKQPSFLEAFSFITKKLLKAESDRQKKLKSGDPGADQARLGSGE